MRSRSFQSAPHPCDLHRSHISKLAPVLVSIVVCAILIDSPVCSAQSTSTLLEKSLPEKVIIDTDIVDDIDDALAIALALRTPELHILGISTAFRAAETRPQLLDRSLAGFGPP